MNHPAITSSEKDSETTTMKPSDSGPTEASGAAATAGKRSPENWTDEEQKVLEEGLAEYSSDPYFLLMAKIAANMRTKTIRDVALRCRWMEESAEERRKWKVEEKEAMEKSATDGGPCPPSYPDLETIPISSDDADVGFKNQEIGGKSS